MLHVGDRQGSGVDAAARCRSGPVCISLCTLLRKPCAWLLGWRTDSFRSGTPTHRCSEGTTIKADVEYEHKLCDTPQYFDCPTRPTLIITVSPTGDVGFLVLSVHRPAERRGTYSRNFIQDSTSASIRIAEAQQVKVSADIFSGPLAVDIISTSPSSAQLPFRYFRGLSYVFFSGKGSAHRVGTHRSGVLQS